MFIGTKSPWPEMSNLTWSPATALVPGYFLFLNQGPEAIHEGGTGRPATCRDGETYGRLTSGPPGLSSAPTHPIKSLPPG